MPRFRRLHSNNAKTALTAPAASDATTIAVADATVFNSPSDDEYERATLERQSDKAVEIVNILARPSGTTLTMERGLEGTTQLDLVAGDTVSGRDTAGILDSVPGGRDGLFKSIAENPGGVASVTSRVAIFGPELDFTDVGSAGDLANTTMAFNPYGRFFPDECGVIGTNISGVSVAPWVQIAYDSETDDLVNAVEITLLATHDRQRWTTMAWSGGVYNIEFIVNPLATATSFLGRFYAVGLYTEI